MNTWVFIRQFRCELYFSKTAERHCLERKEKKEKTLLNLVEELNSLYLAHLLSVLFCSWFYSRHTLTSITVDSFKKFKWKHHWALTNFKNIWKIWIPKKLWQSSKAFKVDYYTKLLLIQTVSCEETQKQIMANTDIKKY